MNWWHRNTIARQLSRVQRREIERIGPGTTGISPSTFAACHEAAIHTPACTALGLIYTEGIGYRRVVMRPLSIEDWTALERGGFANVDWGPYADNFMYMLDSLH